MDTKHGYFRRKPNAGNHVLRTFLNNRNPINTKKNKIIFMFLSMD